MSNLRVLARRKQGPRTTDSEPQSADTASQASDRGLAPSSLAVRLAASRSALTHVRTSLRTFTLAVERLDRFYVGTHGDAASGEGTTHSTTLGMLDSARFYVPTTRGDGLEVDPTSDEATLLPERERRLRQTAVDATLRLRRAVDDALPQIAAIGTHADSPLVNADQRWTHLTSNLLRLIRGLAQRGRGGQDLFPSALPMPCAGIPDAAEPLLSDLTTRIEDLSSAASLGDALP